MNTTHSVTRRIQAARNACLTESRHKCLPITLSGLLLLGCSAMGSAMVSAADVVLDEIVAVVNEGVVLQSDVEAESNYQQLRARASNAAAPSAAQLRQASLDTLIDREIQRQRASSIGIEVEQTNLNRAIERIASNNNMDAFQFRQSLQQQGFDYNYFRSGVQHELLLARLVQRDVTENITITETEIDNYLSEQASAPGEYLISHILLAVDAAAAASQREQTRLRAEQLATELGGGRDFAATATAVSDGRRAINGGDLGWRTLDELPGFLTDVVPKLSIGEVSQPIQSNNGYHIIKLRQQRVAGAEEPGEELRLRHIFITSSTPADSSAAQRTLEALRQRIQSGASFAELAQEFSEDPDSKANGGELPWLESGKLPLAMEQMALSLPINSLSKPFRTEFGWHILEVLERRAGGNGNQRARTDAQQALRQQKFAQEVERWRQRLRSEAFIDIVADRS